MNRARPRQVADARDRVHAFIGLYNSLFNDEMRADYSANLATVYTSFAKRLIKATNSLRILSLANCHYAVTPNLPSWVPDWASMHDHVAEALDLSWWDAHCPFWNFRPVSFSNHIDDKCSLVVEGYIDRDIAVSATADVLEGCTSRATAVDTLAAWQRFFQDLAPSEIDSCGSFAFTLYRGIQFFQKVSHRFSMLALPGRRISHVVRLTDDEMSRFPEGFEALMNKRLFFIEGRPGIGPRHMRSGDVVAWLAGANVPFLLRHCMEGPVAKDTSKSLLTGGTTGSTLESAKSQHANSSTQAQSECPKNPPPCYYVVGPCFVAGQMDYEPTTQPHTLKLRKLILV